MNRLLPYGQIAQTSSSCGFLSRKLQDPFTNVLRDFQVSLVAKQFITVQKSLTNQRSPNNDRHVFRVSPRPARIIKMVSPTGVGIQRRRVLDQPIKAANSPSPVILVSSTSQHRE